MALQPWVGRTGGQLDADSPLDITLHNSYDDDLIHLRQVTYGNGSGGFMTAADPHTHNGVNSIIIGTNGVPNAALQPTSVTYLKLQDVSVGDRCVASNEVGRSTVSVIYVIVKETQIGQGGAYRIRFNLRSSSGSAVFGKIYRNGVAVGTERSTTSVTDVLFSEDIAGWTATERVQLFAKATGGATAHVNFLQLYVDDPIAQAHDDLTL